MPDKGHQFDLYPGDWEESFAETLDVPRRHGREAVMSRPNIVWILTDEWRHDAAGYAGNPVVSTPNLDALAARGTAFRNAYCESPVCQPSRASLLTCRFPSQHGKRQNGIAQTTPKIGPWATSHGPRTTTSSTD